MPVARFGTPRSHVFRPLTALLGAAAFALACAAAPAVAGEITGTVRFDGTAPPPKPIVVTKDDAVCGATPMVDDAVVVGGSKGLKNVLVRIVGAAGAPAMPAPTPNAALDQKGCRFVPRVRIVPAGATLDIVNDDGILHNIRTWSKENPAFNRAQPKFKKVMTQAFAKPEIFKVTCDVHSWMQGWIVVADNAWYTLTDENGAFRLEGVPAGAYTVEFWHETLGAKKAPVTVGATGSATLNQSFSAR